VGTDQISANGPVKTFCLVTACLNAEDWIAETMASILNQTALRSGRARLDYTIRDGGSTDRTLEVVAEELAKAGDLPNVSVRVISEPDDGLYDALVAGFEGRHGDVFGYLNAGDYYSSTCFDVLCDVMSDGVHWVTGMAVIYNAAGHLVNVRLPGPYRAELIRAGYFGLDRPFPPIQQESTFWSAALHAHLDTERLRTLRLAGDAFMWVTFARYAELYVVQTHLGGFRLHGNHLSSGTVKYQAEFATFVDRPTVPTRVKARLTRLVWALHPRAKLLLSGGRIFSWSTSRSQYRTITLRTARTERPRP
jgi:glycosyltransferase involved in cell wall biosynthesis